MNAATEQTTGRPAFTNPFGPDAIAFMAERLTEGLRYNDTATHYHDDVDEDDAQVGMWRYRATVQRDDDTSINDMDCYGKIEWCGRPNSCTGHHDRPAGFTGAARKLGVGRSYDRVWWEPYREGHKVYDSPADVAIVQRLLEEGFHGIVIVVEVLVEWHADLPTGTRLTRQEWREVGSAALWGIDTDEADERRELIGDLLDEAIDEANRTTQAFTGNYHEEGHTND